MGGLDAVGQRESVVPSGVSLGLPVTESSKLPEGTATSESGMGADRLLHVVSGPMATVPIMSRWRTGAARRPPHLKRKCWRFVQKLLKDQFVSTVGGATSVGESRGIALR